MGKKSIFLAVFVFFLSLFNILSPIVNNWSRLVGKFDPKLAERKYNLSQYIIPRSKNPISDEELLSFAGYKYATGTNPILINSDHPPLGKYIIGWFILLSGNKSTVAVFFALGNILLLASLVFLLTKSYLLSLISFLFLSLDTVFLDQIIYSPVLDIIQVFFLQLYILFYLIWLIKKSWFYILFLGISLGAMASVKLYFPAFILFFVTSLHIFITKKSAKTTLLISSIILTVAFLVYTASYANYFFQGNSFRNFLGTQKWMFLFWKNNSIEVAKYYGGVIPFILFNQWKVWWGDKKYINFEHWSILWPIFFTLGIFIAFYFIYKNTMSFRTKRQRSEKSSEALLSNISFFLSMWVVVFTIYLCIIPISPRYLMMLYFPIYILITLFLKNRFKNIFH